jgi:DNA-binding MarR family transcriptional regulator
MNRSILADFIANMGQFDLEDLEPLLKVLAIHVENLKRKSQDVAEEKADLETLETIRATVVSQRGGMSAWELALLCCWHLHLSGADDFNARQLNSLMTELHCRPANITTVMDALRGRRAINMTGRDEEGRHKSFFLTPEGIEEAQKLLRAPRLLTKTG